MTPDEMDKDVADAALYLSITMIRVDRCRHESVTETTLWFFNPQGHQIAAASRLPGSDWAERNGHAWEVTRMLNGHPVARSTYRTLIGVTGDVLRYEPSNRRLRPNERTLEPHAFQQAEVRP